MTNVDQSRLQMVRVFDKMGNGRVGHANDGIEWDRLELVLVVF